VKHRAGALLAPLAMILAMAAPGFAQAQLDLRLVDATLESDGTTTVVVAVEGDVIGDEGVPADAFTVAENGEQIEGLRVAPIIEEEIPPPSAIVLVFDVSGSTAGEPLEAAQDAALRFIETVMPRGVEVGLVPFSTNAAVTVPVTDDLEAVTDGIAELEAEGRTALYDAVILAAQQLEGRDGERRIVLFTDGGDNESTADLEAATTAANAVGAPLVNVALITNEQDPDVLERLATATDGDLLEVQDLEQLEVAFAEVARSLTSQYVLRYSNDLLSDEIDLRIEVAHAGQQAFLEAVLVNPREEIVEDALLEPAPADVPRMGRLGEPIVLAFALMTTFLALLVVFGLLLVTGAERRASRTLKQSVTMIERPGRSSATIPDSTVVSTPLGRAAVDLVARAPKPAGYDERLQAEIDRAGWQLRSSEFTLLHVVAVLVGSVVFGVLSGSVLLGLLGAVLGAVIPRLVLSAARTRRQAKFMKQLPDTLQLLAGTLKAGYGVLQAIDTIIRELEDPTSTEFQRALTEARLGMPLEDSLGDMADRIDSDDFRWVVVAMNIQRQVGGNLAELLETVAETLRGREQVRRQISALSAEGRLSAIILISLPFLILGFLLLTNPAYLAPLFTNLVGWIMLGLVAVLMVIGVFWIRRMIAIDV
jgi:tight adherence protein B